jgi:TonB family protein
MYLSSMNENVSRNTPAYVFEIQQLLLQQNLPVGTEDAMIAVAAGLAKGTALRASLGRELRAIINRESGRINAMELLSLIMTASASPVEPLPNDRMERAMHETLGFILEVREQGKDVREVDLSAGMMRSSQRRRFRSEPLLSAAPREKFSFSFGGSKRILAIAICCFLAASLVIGLSRLGRHANVKVAQSIAPMDSQPEADPDPIVSVAGAAKEVSQPSKNARVRHTIVQGSEKSEAQRTPTPQIAPAVDLRTRPLRIKDSRSNSAPARANTDMLSVIHPATKSTVSHPATKPTENVAAPTQSGRVVAANVSAPVVAPAISIGGSRPAAPSRGVVQSGSAGIMAANLISSPTPAYPAAARSAHIEGEVTVNALVGKDGNVLHATVVSGPPLLREAALKAVEQWQYRPYLISGKPAVMTTTAIVAFELAHD